MGGEDQGDLRRDEGGRHAEGHLGEVDRHRRHRRLVSPALPKIEAAPTEQSAPPAPPGGRVSFALRLGLVWAALLALFVAFFLTFDLKFSFILEKLPALAGFRLTRDGFFQGAALTLFVCLVAIACSIVLGFLSALGRLSGSAVLFGISTFYTSFFRGTPLLVQMFLIYLGLPQLGPVPAAIPSGIIALSLNYGAYLGEIFRAGIGSIPHGQREAARALGLHRGIVMCKIVLPQAMRVIIRRPARSSSPC